MENAVDVLLAKVNDSSITSYEAGTKGEMYTFSHTAGTQQTGYTQEELTDYRYIGNTPNNWVTFNNEDWRIIGVFTVEDETGKKEQRIKLIRDQSIGNYSWDNSTIENSLGKNRWSDARLQMLLNPGYEKNEIGGSLYWNKRSGACYAGYDNATTTCDFTSTGLSSEAKGLIGDVKWYLGGLSFSSSTKWGTKETIYQNERGTTVYNSATYPRENNWIGKVGLMYPSDYAYTYALGVNNQCDTDVYECVGSKPISGWLFNYSFQWTISPLADASFTVFLLSSGSYVGDYYPHNDFYGVRPVVYLRSDAQLVSGDGTTANKYIFE